MHHQTVLAGHALIQQEVVRLVQQHGSWYAAAAVQLQCC
jgi:hypothetical protein